MYVKLAMRALRKAAVWSLLVTLLYYAAGEQDLGKGKGNDANSR